MDCYLSWGLLKCINHFTNLDIINVSQALSRIDDDENLLYAMYISGQNRDTWIVNESGLYSLILRSNKLEAKIFKKWITSEVIPSIRKTGGYSIAKPSYQIDDPIKRALKVLLSY